MSIDFFIRMKDTFLTHLTNLRWQPNIWFDDDYLELGFEWISEDRSRHAVVSFDGCDENYGYCYKVGDKFVAGKEFDPHVSRFPDDLREYLND